MTNKGRKLQVSQVTTLFYFLVLFSCSILFLLGYILVSTRILSVQNELKTIQKSSILGYFLFFIKKECKKFQRLSFL